MSGDDERADRSSRRTFLAVTAATLGGAYAATAAVVAGTPLLAPAFRPDAEGEWVDVCAVDNLPVGEPKQVVATVKEQDAWLETTSRRAAWAVRDASDEVTVFNARCTHLGCAYRWDESSSRFECPCHGGQYDRAGKVVGGPPPRGLDRLPVKVEDGRLKVRFSV
ncbi:MAG: ubiquinol-cytochrome c reductase iron-sulfur subunit [bacterium]